MKVRIECLSPEERGLFSDMMDELEIHLKLLIDHHQKDLKEGPGILMAPQTLAEWRASYEKDIAGYREMLQFKDQLQELVWTSPVC